MDAYEQLARLGEVAQQAIDRERCECGDYRSQHILGVGWCRLCAWNPAAPGESCGRFRLTAKPSDAKRLHTVEDNIHYWRSDETSQHD